MVDDDSPVSFNFGLAPFRSFGLLSRWQIKAMRFFPALKREDRYVQCLEPGHRFFSFASRASAAEYLRSRCGPVRWPPEVSPQGSLTAASHVGQGTDSICFGVKSLLFIRG